MTSDAVREARRAIAEKLARENRSEACACRFPWDTDLGALCCRCREHADAVEIELQSAEEQGRQPLEMIAREFIDYYTGKVRHPSGGCGNCGGVPHSTTCFVGRFIKALEVSDGQ